MTDVIKQELNLFWNTDSQSHNGKRTLYLDMARGIAIILVVMGHSIFVNDALNIWLSTFHLPAFFFISGWLIQEKSEYTLPFSSVIKKKATGILIPYLWFSVGSLLLDFIKVLLGSFTLDILTTHFIETITFQGYSVMWFLPVLFLSELFVLLLLKVLHNSIPSRLLTAVILSAVLFVCGFYTYQGYQSLLETVASPLLLNELRILAKSVIAATFISFGYLLSAICTDTKKEVSARAKTSFSLLGLLLGIILTGFNIYASGSIHIMDLNNLNLGSVTLYFLLGTTGSLGLLLICRSIPNIPLLTFYGQNTLIIMCTHLNFYIMYLAELICFRIAGYFPWDDLKEIAVFSIIGTMTLEILVILLTRIFLPFTLGKPIRPRKK
ncbi:MAG: acyltransferase family protein [Lachnospiraceae bacterium]|nr:acyltransferase family protein [Lachnospiraceae bacterium]